MNNKTYNVTSFGQVGGITAGEVYLQKPKRLLGEQCKAQLKEQLRNGDEITVSVISNDNESLQFTAQIMAFLKREGYKSDEKDFNVHLVTLYPVIGLHVEKHGQGKVHLIIGMNDAP